MKYLDKRNEFLKKSLTKIKIYNQLEKTDYERINEEAESGPFANDIPWGDSLVGRLINSTIRKAKIGANLLNIDRVIKRLKDNFDELIDMSKIKSDKEATKKLYQLMRLAYLHDLKNAVYNTEPLQEIKNLCDTAIDRVEKADDIEEKDELLRQLKEFRKFLDTIKEDPKKEEVPVKEDEVYKKYLQNFKSVFVIVQEYAKMKNEKPIPSEKIEIEIGKEYVYTNKNGQTSIVKVVDKEHPRKTGPDKQWLTGDDEIEKQTNIKPKVFVIWRDPSTKTYKSNAPAQSVDISTLSKLSPLREPNQPEPIDKKIGTEVKTTTGKGQNSSESVIRYSFLNERSEEKTQDSKILIPIKSLYSYFNKDAGETIKELDTFFKANDSYKNNTRLKDPIVKIYKHIKSKFGIKESAINDFLGRPEDIGDKIYELYQISKTKDDGGFEGIGDSMKLAIVEFNRTMKSIITVKEEPNPEAKEEPKPQAKSQSQEEENYKGKAGLAKEETDKKFGEKLIFSYSDFIKKINEESDLVGGTDMTKGFKETGEKETVEKETESQEEAEEDNKILAWWKKNMKIDKWLGTKEEVKELKDDCDKKLEETQESCTIYGIDPIIEIVKCFNRAYKIHTTQVIPTGRGGGKVSNSVFMEYTCFGNGSPANAGSGGGPYRNNVIFNKWEKAVLDIMGDSKYKPVFDKGTKIIKKEGSENKKIDGVGLNLVKFMNRLLDGDELYKTDGGKSAGAQYKFLKEYFGYQEADGDPSFNIGGKSDIDAITPVADGIKTINLYFTQDQKQYKSPEDLKWTFFAAKAESEDGKGVVDKFFFISDINGSESKVICCSKFGHLWEWIQKSGVSPKLSQKNTLPITKPIDKRIGGNEAKLMSFKCDIKKLINLDGSFNIKNKKIKIKYNQQYNGDINSKRSPTNGEIEIPIKNEIFSLLDEKGERYRLSKKPNSELFDSLTSIEGVNGTSIEVI
jgi:hypothetical protein